jgi:hypothetical protein
MPERDYGLTFMRERIDQQRAAATPAHTMDQRGRNLRT